MSKTNVDAPSEEWTTVTKAHRKRVARRARGRASSTNIDKTAPLLENEELSLEAMAACQQRLLEELPKSAFFQSLTSLLENLPAVTKIVCYGVGNFGTQSAPQWQLACATALQALLCEDKSPAGSKLSMEYYDPCATQNEIIFLERNGVNVSPVNQRGRRFVDEPTLFFMPHCPLSLYTNVLYTNWERLDQVIVFGNSLSAYANRLVVNKHVRLLQLLEPSWSELLITLDKSDVSERSGNFEKAFNDCSITTFRMAEGSDGFPGKPSNFSDDADDVDETI